MLNDKEMMLLRIINEITKIDGYAEYWKIYNWARIRNLINRKSSGKDMKSMIMNLKNSGKIESLPDKIQCFKPIISEEEAGMINQLEKKSPVTDEKVKYCIRRFFYLNTKLPKPADIEMQFIKEWGMPEQKDFTRLLRKMVEDGKLERDDDNRYSYKGINIRENGLGNYVC